MGLEDVVRKTCRQVPPGRLVVSPVDSAHCGLIDQGILFVMALWSGTSIRSFRVLCDVIATVGDSGPLIYVVDADDINPEKFREESGDVPQGKGETFWIHGGRVVRIDHGYSPRSVEAILSGVELLATS
jgi:hypothetical protein